MIWKNINEFDNYLISENGDIKNIKTGKINKCQINKNGYTTIKLSQNNKPSGKYIHKLVAEHFLNKPESDKKLSINHIDGNKQNNNYLNLEWITYSENLLHSYRTLNRCVNKKSGIYDVLIYLNNNIVNETRGVASASRFTGVSETQIRRLLDSGKSSRGGYSFKYKKDVEDIEKVDNN